MKNLTEIKKDLETKNCSEIQPGVYLYTAENLQSKQKDWCDDDENKNFDFTDARYWIIADSDSYFRPEAYSTIQEVYESYTCTSSHVYDIATFEQKKKLDALKSNLYEKVMNDILSLVNDDNYDAKQALIEVVG